VLCGWHAVVKTGGVDVDVAALARRLGREVRGEVDFGTSARAQYSADASNYRRVPLGVVWPADADDVIATVAACREFGAPITPRGGGTSVAGNAIGGGVVVDTSRHFNELEHLDPQTRTARVQPGLVLDRLRGEAARHRLTFGPDPSTHSRCTLGGMIGNNACGSHSVIWGKTSENVDTLDVLRYDGTRQTVGAGADGLLRELADANLALIRQKFGRFVRQVSGYALDELLPERGRNVARALVGTEGTCVTVLGATVRLVEVPAARVLLVLGFANDGAAADAVPLILPHRPLTVEGIDTELVGSRATPEGLPAGNAWLFVELGGESVPDAVAAARKLARDLDDSDHRPRASIVTDERAQRALWRIREEGAGIATRMPDGAEAWPGWEDAAVPPEKLGAYLREFRELKQRHGLRGVTYGHFGEGCIHVRLDFDLLSAAGVTRFRRFVEEAADLVALYGGSYSGEHGDGNARSELLPRMYGAEVTALFGQFKAFWDPDDKMNPGVVVRPSRIDENLKHDRQPRELLTVFAYPHDAGDFAQATRRCVGVGKCRNTAGTAMCPSYQVTGEEEHSTRGRARLLFEMVRGDVVTGGWRSSEVRDALDLCLSCKACKSDCPVGVDMATYKAEFLHHHYAGRLRPASHYSMGFLPLWARLPPWLMNAAGRVPGAKRLAGVAPERDLPSFAPESFDRWFRNRAPSRGGGRRVVLWPDTFTNYLTPEVGRAAVEVLESAGFEVVIPDGTVCCGLTWISTGQLGIARRVARRSFDRLRPHLDAGALVVGLEPSCTAVLRSDLPELLPGEETTRLAERTRTLAELLVDQDWEPQRRDGDALMQVHCHQRAVLGATADAELVARVGLAQQPLEPSCCGLAGNFGFERGHYAVSQAVGERVLLPAVRAASPETVLLADGFSCRTQIAHATGRRALHLAELLAGVEAL
jgi:FAD/FMN-containing dehydrogenase/Fe-S oxidoreductase